MATLSVCLVVVIVQVALSGERALTALGSAVIGLFTSVQSQMRLEVTFLVESLAAVLKWTDEVTLALVLFEMHLEALLPTVALIAALDRADEVLGLLMGLRMVAQVTLRHERLVAARKVALERTIIFQLQHG